MLSESSPERERARDRGEDGGVLTLSSDQLQSSTSDGERLVGEEPNAPSSGEIPYRPLRPTHIDIKDATKKVF